MGTGRGWLLAALISVTAAAFAAVVALTGLLGCGISGCGGGGFGPAYAPGQAQLGLLLAGGCLAPLAWYLLRPRPVGSRLVAVAVALVLGSALAMALLGLGPDGCPWGQSPATAGPEAFSPGSRTCSGDPAAR